MGLLWSPLRGSSLLLVLRILSLLLFTSSTLRLLLLGFWLSLVYRGLFFLLVDQLFATLIRDDQSVILQFLGLLLFSLSSPLFQLNLSLFSGPCSLFLPLLDFNLPLFSSLLHLDLPPESRAVHLFL